MSSGRTIKLPSFQSPKKINRPDHNDHHHHGHYHDDDEERNGIELPGLSELPGLIKKAQQREADKYKGKRPHEIMSASQWRAANKHNEGRKGKNIKPPKGLVTTDGAHFFSSVRVLNFYERTKNNLVKQQAEVLNRAHTFNERDMNTFKQMWEEKAILEGNIDQLRDDIIMRSRKLDCACDLKLHLNHLRAKKSRIKLSKLLQKKDTKVIEIYQKKVAKYEDEKEKWKKLKMELLGDQNTQKTTSPSVLMDLRPPTPMLPPSGLLDLPRAETMESLKYRRTPTPKLCSFESTDVFLVDSKIIQYLVRIFEEGIDGVNLIAEEREEQSRLAEEERKRKKEERIALAKAAEEAAMLSSDSEEEEEEKVDPDMNLKKEILIILNLMIKEVAENAGEENTGKGDTNTRLILKKSEESSEEDDSTYAFSEHSSDFEDEFDEETYGTGGQASSYSLHGPSSNENEYLYIENLMNTAIVRIKNKLVPPTFMKFISEAYELIPKDVRLKYPRFVDLTGSTGATALLTSLWCLGWSSTVTYENTYEDLILSKLYLKSMEQIISGKIVDKTMSTNSDDTRSNSSNSDSESIGENTSESEADEHQGFNRFTSNSSSYSTTKTVDPQLLPKEYQKNALLNRLSNQVFSVKRKFDFSSSEPWLSTKSEPWRKADVILIDENKMQDIENNTYVANILRTIVNSLAWQDREFEPSLMNLCYSYVGKAKMYQENEYTGREEILRQDQMEVLLEELEKNEDDKIGQYMKASDPQTYEYYHLKHCLKQRLMLSNQLKKVKDNCLIIIIRPERSGLPRTNDHQYHTKVVKGHDDDDDVGTTFSETKSATIECQSENSRVNENDKYSEIEEYFDDDEEEEFEEFKEDEINENITFWNRPTYEMRADLLDRWLDEPFFKESTRSFEEVTDNFVFKTMKKAKLWDDGVKISAVLYRRKARSPYNMPIQQRK